MQDKTDVSKLSFSLQLVIVVVSTALTVGAAVWTVTGQIRSDLRDIRTRMDLSAEAAEKVRQTADQLVAERLRVITVKADDVDKNLKLLELKFEALQADVLKMQR